MLFEEGRFALSDPITRRAPEFSQMRVLHSPTGPLNLTDPAKRPITFEDLLTHRSGLTYGAFHAGPIAGAHKEALGGDIDSEVIPDDWIAGLVFHRNEFDGRMAKNYPKKQSIYSTESLR